jgi:uroporphyrinogen decarboxylase
MDCRQRVLRALRFEDTPIVPHHVNLTAESRQRLVQFYGDADLETRLGNHLAVLSHRRLEPETEVAPGHFQDAWGVVWNRNVDREIGSVVNQVLPEPSLQGFRPPDPAPPGVARAYPRFIADNSPRFRVASLAFGLFERGWSLRGFATLLMDMLQSPEFVEALFDRLLEYHLARIESALAHDVDAVFLGDDWGSQSGMIMGPALWRRFIKPRVARLYARVRQAGKCVMIHSCGDIRAILPDLVEIGVQVLNPFQPETLDLVQTKRQYQGRLAFYGGISVQRLLPHGTPDEVRRETQRLLRELGALGGYIASPSHAVPPDVPPENIAAMVDVFRRQRA